VIGAVPDYQMSAFLMAVYFQGMKFDETVWLTDAMLHSGEIVDLSHVPGLKVDKHSTGGVGDKLSLIVAPIAAACGVRVPMISGRGLGHTGGTLDKLESIPGFQTALSTDEYKRVIEEIGIVMIGQTESIAPADKKLYALRDVTGTVESIPLIASSIMSKKLAEGIDALVLDVKAGSGAFMTDVDEALELAKTIVAVGKRFGKKPIAFLTRMDEPLGCAVGNWLEVAESVRVLQGEYRSDLLELSTVLAGAMIKLGGKAASIQEGAGRAKEALQSGKAYRKFLEMVKRQGGDVAVVERPETYPRSEYSLELKSAKRGFIASMEAREVGLACCLLGAGRLKVDDPIDPKAGILLKKKVGDFVERGEAIAVLFTDRQEALRDVENRLLDSIRVTQAKPRRSPVIRAVVQGNNARPWRRLEPR